MSENNFQPNFEYQLTPEEMEYYGLTEADIKQFDREIEAYFGRQGVIDVGIYDEQGHCVGINDDEWGY